MKIQSFSHYIQCHTLRFNPISCYNFQRLWTKRHLLMFSLHFLPAEANHKPSTHREMQQNSQHMFKYVGSYRFNVLFWEDRYKLENYAENLFFLYFFASSIWSVGISVEHFWEQIYITFLLHLNSLMVTLCKVNSPPRIILNLHRLQCIFSWSNFTELLVCFHLN